MSTTLAIDRTGLPLARISWQRAITLLFAEKVELVEEYPDREVRSVRLTLKMPSIVRFLGAVRGRKRMVKFSRENVYLRDNARCGYCSVKVPRYEATYDHVLPRALGGTTTWENIVIACEPCNTQKGARTPEQAKMALRKKPVRPTSLAVNPTLAVEWRRGDPPSWRQFLLDQSYWEGALEEG